MADDRTKRGRIDRERINLAQEHEVRYWCDKFGCTERMLRDAVARVGNAAADVDRHLAGC